MPESFEGVLIANELLDAMPVHQVVMREDGLREVYIENHGSELRLREGPLSTPRLTEYFAAIGANLEPGWRAEVSLTAIDWVRDASRRLKRGFIDPDRLRSRRRGTVFGHALSRHADEFCDSIARPDRSRR